MNNLEKDNDFLLRQYLNSERIEKAPEGFTSKVMSRIQLETSPAKRAGMFRNKNFIPVISAAVTIALLTAAFLTPSGQSDSLTLSLARLVKNFKAYLPSVDLTSILNISVPSTLIYIILGIVLLSAFDRALYGVFHKEKNN